MKTQRFLFVADPWQEFKLDRDSSAEMMRVAMNLSIVCDHCLISDIFVDNQGLVRATSQEIIYPGTLAGKPIKATDNPKALKLNQYTAVLMRKNPPFNMAYVMCLWLLRLAKLQGAVVVNDPEAILSHSEKISIFEFPKYIAPTIITSRIDEINKYIQKNKDVVIKPLNSFDGLGVRRYHIDEGEKKLQKFLAKYPPGEPLMLQKFMPAVKKGDKRVFIIGNKVIPYVNNRLLMYPDDRENLGHIIINQIIPIAKRDAKIAQKVANKYHKLGLILVGIDIIDGKLTEINVTSPTCMIVIEQESGIKVAELAVNEILKYAKKFKKIK